MSHERSAFRVKTLIIIANPSKKSFSHAMADTYSKKCEEFEILDLYDFNQSFFRYESMEELYKGNCEETDKIKEIQEKITACDEMAFFFPVWWGGGPAILKNFFDANFASGFAFQYGKGGKVTKLLTGKTAKIFTTCDAPGFVYKIPFLSGISIKRFFDKAILDFCGIKLTEFKLISKFHKMSEDEKKSILENI